MLLLIDGSSLLSTSFYGSVPNEYRFAKTDEERANALPKFTQTSDGQYTNGVITMMHKLENILNTPNITHLAVAWDLNRDTFRRDIYPEYKMNRKETVAELKSQFAIAQLVLKEMNIAQFVLNRYEADDIIGTLAKQLKAEIPVIVLTADQDALQLVDEEIRMWRMTKQAGKLYQSLGIDVRNLTLPENIFEYTPSYVEHFYGVTPKQIIDRKALEGDVVDNIPGVAGLGEKSIIPLLKEFKSVEGIYDYIESVEEEKECKAFIKSLGVSRSPLASLTKTSETELVGKKSAMISKKLATIYCEIPELMDVVIDDLVINIDLDKRLAIYEKLEFSTLLNKKSVLV